MGSYEVAGIESIVDMLIERGFIKEEVPWNQDWVGFRRSSLDETLELRIMVRELPLGIFISASSNPFQGKYRMTTYDLVSAEGACSAIQNYLDSVANALNP